MHKSKSGFTIVEILVVIVIIGVLSSITVVAYNGIQDRAKATQTISAAEQWLKALQIHKARNNEYPAATGCLGDTYGWGVNAATAQGTEVAQCRQTTGLNLTTNSALTTALSKYITGFPTPAMITASSSATDWYRGLYYNRTGANSSIEFTLPAGATCPVTISGAGTLTSTVATNGNRLCAYNIGLTVGY